MLSVGTYFERLQTVNGHYISTEFELSSHLLYMYFMHINMGFPGGSDGEESACNAADPGLIPG